MEQIRGAGKSLQGMKRMAKDRDMFRRWLHAYSALQKAERNRKTRRLRILCLSNLKYTSKIMSLMNGPKVCYLNNNCVSQTSTISQVIQYFLIIYFRKVATPIIVFYNLIKNVKLRSKHVLHEWLFSETVLILASYQSQDLSTPHRFAFYILRIGKETGRLLHYCFSWKGLKFYIKKEEDK